jgi:hypothetical protein
VDRSGSHQAGDGGQDAPFDGRVDAGGDPDVGKSDTALDPDAPLTCDWMWSSFRGPLVSGQYAGSQGVSFWKWDIFMTFRDDSPSSEDLSGAVVLHGDGHLMDATLPCEGFFHEPGSAQDHRSWFCVGVGSTVTEEVDKQTFYMQLRSLSDLGPCPGTPVDGEVVVCHAGSQYDGGAPECRPGGTRVTGSVAEQPVAYDPVDGPNRFSPTSATGFLGEGGMFLFYTTDGHARGTFALDPLETGISEVFCIGSESFAVLDDDVRVYTLRGLSTLGSCPGALVEGVQEVMTCW